MEDLALSNLFNNIYKGRRVLLTGHTGFKGSWLSLWLHQLGAKVSGFALAPYKGPSHFNLLELKGASHIGDLRDRNALKKAFQTARPEIVFHLAAQPLVRRSYEDPLETFETNIIGTANLFENIRQSKTVKAVVNITTDKVYDNKEWPWGYRETDGLGGHDPYSTSKACVELLHQSYRKSFLKEAGIASATARAGNVIGGGDWAKDRLIPDIVRAAQKKAAVDIRNPKSVRPWQHVLDPLAGYLLLGQNLLEGKGMADDSWNFGPSLDDCLSVASLLDHFHAYWLNAKWKDVSKSEKPHESGELRLDCSKAIQQLGWRPIWNIHQALEKTAIWYKDYYSNGQVLSIEQLEDFIRLAQARKAVWTL